MDEAERQALTDYVCALFAPEDEVLQAIDVESAKRGLPHFHIRPDEGRMLQFLMAAVGARQVVEIGTLAGYSGTWIARALPAEGRLISLERNPEHAELARATFARAGLADRVEVRVGVAPQALDALAQEGPFDAVFIDADKISLLDYLEWAIKHTRRGGVILAHNAFMRGRVIDPAAQDDPAVQAMRTFTHRMATDPRLLGTVIPIGDGIVAAVRLS